MSEGRTAHTVVPCYMIHLKVVERLLVCSVRISSFFRDYYHNNTSSLCAFVKSFKDVQQFRCGFAHVEDRSCYYASTQISTHYCVTESAVACEFDGVFCVGMVQNCFIVYVFVFLLNS